MEAAGYAVDLALGESQGSAISQGDLERAKRQGTHLFTLLDQLSGNSPILVCEPSCATALAEDLPDLLDDEYLGQRVAGRMQMLESLPRERTGNRSLPISSKGTRPNQIETVFRS